MPLSPPPEQLYGALGIGKTGKISDYANDMIQTGLLARDFTWSLQTGLDSKLSRLRISDNYLRFYLKYIQPNRRRIERGTLTRLPNIDSILGLQFESIVLQNRLSVFQLLGIDANDVSNDNPFFQSKTRRRQGCQIDYLIQTRHRTLYVCEVKFSKDPIPLAVAEVVREKVKRLQIPKGMSYRTVLIHAGSLSSALEAEDFFSATIDLGQLLN